MLSSDQLVLITSIIIITCIISKVCFAEPTNMLDMKAVIWLETYLQVVHVLLCAFYILLCHIRLHARHPSCHFSIAKQLQKPRKTPEKSGNFKLVREKVFCLCKVKSKVMSICTAFYHEAHL